MRFTLLVTVLLTPWLPLHADTADSALLRAQVQAVFQT
jgi:hypothetical protein